MHLLSQPTLFQLSYLIADRGRHSIGLLGEQAAARMLEQSGYDIITQRIGSQNGDMKAIDRQTGEVLKVEVKTARRSKKGWQFTLFKKGRTDYRHADVVILLVVLDSGRCVPYVIPRGDLGERSKIDFRTSPERYKGKWAAYRQDSKAVRLS